MVQDWSGGQYSADWHNGSVAALVPANGQHDSLRYKRRRLLASLGLSYGRKQGQPTFLDMTVSITVGSGG